MWPFSTIQKFEEKIDELTRRNDRLESLQISETDKKELEFLRGVIKDYVVYSCENVGYPGWNVDYLYFAKRTLKDAERDLANSKFYISVLEVQLGQEGTSAARDVCERLKELCTRKAEVKE